MYSPDFFFFNNLKGKGKKGVKVKVKVKVKRKRKAGRERRSGLGESYNIIE